MVSIGIYWKGKFKMKASKKDKKVSKPIIRTNCQGLTILKKDSAGKEKSISVYCGDYKRCEVCNARYRKKLHISITKAVKEYDLYKHVTLTFGSTSSAHEASKLMQGIFKKAVNLHNTLSYDLYVARNKTSYPTSYKKDGLKDKYKNHINKLRNEEISYAIHVYNSEQHHRYSKDPNKLKETNPKLYAKLAEEVDRKLSKILGVDIKDVLAGNVFPDRIKFHYIRTVELGEKSGHVHYHVLANYFLPSLFADAYDSAFKHSKKTKYPNIKINHFSPLDLDRITDYITKQLDLDYMIIKQKYKIDSNNYATSRDPVTNESIINLDDVKTSHKHEPVLDEEGKSVSIKARKELHSHKFDSADETDTVKTDVDEYNSSIEKIFAFGDKKLIKSAIFKKESITRSRDKDIEIVTNAFIIDEISKKMNEPVTVFDINPGFDVDSLEADKEQKAFIDSINKSNIIILSGCAGSGKSTVTAAALSKYYSSDRSVLVTCNSNKAVEVIKNKIANTGIDISNITFGNICKIMNAIENPCRFSYNQDDLDYDLIVIDEVGMVEPQKLLSILLAAKPESKIILVGDKFQLPPVRSETNLFHLLNMFDSNSIYYELTENHRMTGSYHLNILSNDIRNGKVDKLKELISTYDETTVLNLYENGYRFLAKTNDMCTRVHMLIATSTGRVPLAGQSFCVGDNVMCTENNYVYGVYNGEEFEITEYKDENITLHNDKHTISIAEDEIKLATTDCVTVEKFQGNESDKICIILEDTALKYLSMNWLYTAVTRAKKELVILNNTSLSDEELLTTLSNAKYNDSRLPRYVRLYRLLRTKKEK